MGTIVVAVSALAAAGARSEPDGGDPGLCRGAHVDLDQIRRSRDACKLDGEVGPPPSPGELALEVTPAQLSLPSGKEGKVVVRMRNLTSSPMRLTLDLGLGFSPQVWSGGRRADNVESKRCQEIGAAFGVRRIAIELDPGGEAHAEQTVEALTYVTKADCSVAERPMAAGRYRLRIETPVADAVKGKPDAEPRRRIASAALVVTVASRGH